MEKIYLKDWKPKADILKKVKEALKNLTTKLKVEKAKERDY